MYAVKCEQTVKNPKDVNTPGQHTGFIGKQ